MSSHVRHPAKSFILFALVLAGGYYAWENREMLRAEQPPTLNSEQRMDIREDVLRKFDANPDFLGFRALSWRPSAGRYRIDIEIDDGCTDPKGLCFAVAEFIEWKSEVKSTVIGVDQGGHEVGRAVL